LRSQPRRLLDEHQNLNWPDENDKAIAEDKVAIVDSLNSLSWSDSEELDNQQTWLDDIWRDILTDQSFRYKCYFSACCLKDIKQLGDLIRRYSEDLVANAADDEGNSGIFLVAAVHGGLNTAKCLEQEGVSTDKRNYYGRIAFMEAALWGRLETVQYLIDNGASIRASDLAANSERNEKERISRANKIVMVRPDANRKRSHIVACLTRQESIGQDSLDGAMQSQIHPGYSGKISPNLLWYYKAAISYDIGLGEEIKASQGLIEDCGILL
jgi:hypothetical protein